MTKYLFVLNSRFPTEKAYGVTIKGTAKALTDIGCEVEVWGRGITSSKFSKVLSVALLPQSHKEEMSKFRMLKSVERLHLVFASINMNLKVRKRLRTISEQEVVMIIREYFLFLLVSCFNKNSKFVLEIHQSPNRLFKLTAPLINKKGNVFVCVITESLKKKYAKYFDPNQIFIAGMGVDLKFFKELQTRKPTKNLVGFLGKATSSGYDNGLIKLLPSISRVISNNNEIKFEFVGIEEPYKKVMRRIANELEIPPENIIIRGHVEHSKIPKILENFAVGVIPYPSNEYHDARFPIKTLEYAAAGVPMLVSDVPSTRYLLNPNLAIFFTLDDPESFERGVLELLRNSSLSQEISRDAQQWARDQTYHSRAQIIQNFINRYAN
jgi:glycosyltransferase involved in cell wall biosynthesis